MRGRIESVVRWIVAPLPKTDDPEVRRNVVYVMLLLNVAIFIALCFAAWGYATERNRLDHATTFQHNQCEAGNHARMERIEQNKAIRHYLSRHDGRDVVRVIKDPLLVNCETGEEIPRR